LRIDPVSFYQPLDEAQLVSKFLVTGASGLVGRHLLPLLGDSIAPDHAHLDLSKPLDFEALPVAADGVVYLAQSSRFRDWPNDNGDIHQVNVAAPLALAEYARRSGARHFVYASTGGVYAQSDLPISEGGELARPMSFYPASKHAAEILLAPYAAHFNLVILRFFFVMYCDAVTYLPDDILTKVDRASMVVSLETRVPFLDHRVAELAARIPLDLKVRGGRGKHLVRRLLEGMVPRELVERPKAGFALPIGEWIKGPLRPWAEDLLDSDLIKSQGWFDAERIAQRWRQHLSGKRNSSAAIWGILMFQSWVAAQHGREPEPVRQKVLLAD
jgi:hypothetical protein